MFAGTTRNNNICFSGDPEASFTKEEMQQGKHQEYEKKLHDQLISATLNRFVVLLVYQSYYVGFIINLGLVLTLICQSDWHITKLLKSKLYIYQEKVVFIISFSHFFLHYGGSFQFIVNYECEF